MIELMRPCLSFQVAWKILVTCFKGVSICTWSLDEHLFGFWKSLGVWQCPGYGLIDHKQIYKFKIVRKYMQGIDYSILDMWNHLNLWSSKLITLLVTVRMCLTYSHSVGLNDVSSWLNILGPQFSFNIRMTHCRKEVVWNRFAACLWHCGLFSC